MQRAVLAAIAALASLQFENPAAGDEPPASLPASVSAGAARIDLYGDPLPERAIARLGTTRLRHEESVEGVAFSPDGTLLASCGWDSAIQLWDTQTGRLVRRFDPPGRIGTFGVAFSPDGATLASVGEDGTVFTWETATGRMLLNLNEHQGRVYGVAFAPDGRSFASAGGDAATRVWDATTGEKLAEFRSGEPGGATRGVAFSPDGRRIASSDAGRSTDAGGTISVWDIASGRQQFRTSRVHGRAIVALAFASDGRQLVSSGVVYKHRQIFSEICVWNTETGELVRELTNGELEVGNGSSSLSADGKRLVTGHKGKLCIWNASNWTFLRSIQGPPDKYGARTHGLAISTDGRMIAAKGENDVRIWNAENGAPILAAADSHNSRMQCVAWSPDGNMAATGNGDGTVRLWNPRTGQPSRMFRFAEGFWGAVMGLAFSSDNRLLLAGGEEFQPSPIGIVGAVRAWEIESRRRIESRKFPGRVRAVAIASDGRTCAASTTEFPDDNPGRTNEGLFVWTLAGSDDPARLTTNATQILSLAFSDDPPTLAVSAQILRGRTDEVGRPAGGGLVQFWEPEIGHVRSEINIGGHLGSGSLTSIVVTPRHRLCVSSAFGDDTLLVWDAVDGSLFGRIGSADSYGSELAFSPCGRILASVSVPVTNTLKKYDRRIHLWEVHTGRKLLTLDPNDIGCKALAFSPDGRSLLSGMADTTALVWTVRAAYAGLPEAP